MKFVYGMQIVYSFKGANGQLYPISLYTSTVNIIIFKSIFPMKGLIRDFSIWIHFDFVDVFQQTLSRAISLASNLNKIH